MEVSTSDPRIGSLLGIQFFGQRENKEEKNDRLNGHYDEYMDFDVPWSISLIIRSVIRKNYSAIPLPEPKTFESSNTISQMMRINGDFSLTPKWKIGYSTGYDFQQKEVTATSFNSPRPALLGMTFSCISLRHAPVLLLPDPRPFQSVERPGSNEAGLLVRLVR